MKLRVPETYTGTITDADGEAHEAICGFVTIPDDKMHDGLYGFGFVRVEEEIPVLNVEADEEHV